MSSSPTASPAPSPKLDDGKSGIFDNQQQNGGRSEQSARASITEWELLNLQRLWAVFDTARTGSLWFEELTDLLKCAGISEITTDILIEKYDTILDGDGNGTVEFPHFVEFYITYGHEMQEYRGVKASDEEDHITNLKTSRFYQHSIWRVFWDLLILSISLYYSVRVQYEWYRCANLDSASYGLEITLTILSLCDIGVQCNTMYYDSKGRLVEDLTTIFYHYLSGWMIPEVLGALPADLIIVFMYPDSHCAMLSFLVVRTFRQMRLVRVLFSLFSEATPPGLLTPSYVYFQYRIAPVLRSLFFLILVFHLLTVSWLQVSEYDANPVSYNVYEKNKNATVDYIDALYLVTYTMTTCGFGDIYVETQSQKIFLIFLCLCAALFNGLVISQIGVFLNQADIESFRKEQMRETLAVLNYFSVDDKLQSEILSFQSYLLRQNLSQAHTDLIGAVPQPMSDKVVLAMRRQLIHAVPLFSSCNDEIKDALANTLINSVFCPGQFIIVAGEVGSQMFFVAHGVVDVIAPNGTYLVTLRRGMFFGEMSIFVAGALRTASVKALTYCDVFCLRREDFFHLVGKYRKLKEAIEQQMIERIKDFQSKTSMTTVVKSRSSRPPSKKKITPDEFNKLTQEELDQLHHQHHQQQQEQEQEKQQPQLKKRSGMGSIVISAAKKENIELSLSSSSSKKKKKHIDPEIQQQQIQTQQTGEFRRTKHVIPDSADKETPEIVILSDEEEDDDNENNNDTSLLDSTQKPKTTRQISSKTSEKSQASSLSSPKKQQSVSFGATQVSEIYGDDGDTERESNTTYQGLQEKSPEPQNNEDDENEISRKESKSGAGFVSPNMLNKLRAAASRAKKTTAALSSSTPPDSPPDFLSAIIPGPQHPSTLSTGPASLSSSGRGGGDVTRGGSNMTQYATGSVLSATATSSGVGGFSLHRNSAAAAGSPTSLTGPVEALPTEIGYSLKPSFAFPRLNTNSGLLDLDDTISFLKDQRQHQQQHPNASSSSHQKQKTGYASIKNRVRAKSFTSSGNLSSTGIIIPTNTTTATEPISSTTNNNHNANVNSYQIQPALESNHNNNISASSHRTS